MATATNPVDDTSASVTQPRSALKWFAVTLHREHGAWRITGAAFAYLP